MRILIITGIYPPTPGGPATFSNILKNELPKLGHETRVLTFGDGREPNVFFVSRSWPKGFRHIIFFCKILRHGFWADVILSADSSSGAFLGLVASKIIGKKFVVKITGDYAWEQAVSRFGLEDLIDEFQNRKYGFFIQFLKMIQSFTVKYSNAVIAPSEYLKKIAVRWGAKEKNVSIVYNGVRTPDIRKSREELRRDFGFDGLVVISAGRLVKWKGFEVLIRAFTRVLQDASNAKLLIVGDGPCLNSLQSRVNSLKLNDKVEFMGRVRHDKLFAYLSAADVFVLNTAYEGFSHQIIEAMAMSVPVITTNVGGNLEVIKNGENGLLVAYNDERAIFEAIKRIINDSAFRKNIGEAGRLTALKFSGEEMVKKLLEVL